MPLSPDGPARLTALQGVEKGLKTDTLHHQIVWEIFAEDQSAWFRRAAAHTCAFRRKTVKPDTAQGLHED